MAANFVPIIQASEASRVGGLEGLRQAWKDFAKMALQHMFAASRQCKEASDCRDELIIVRENMMKVIVNVPTIQFLQRLCDVNFAFDIVTGVSGGNVLFVAKNKSSVFHFAGWMLARLPNQKIRTNVLRHLFLLHVVESSSEWASNREV